MLPEEDVKLKAMIKKAKEDFAKGKGLTTNEVRKIVRSWK